MKRLLGLFGMLILVAGIIASPLSASAETYQQVIASSAGTIKVGINTEPALPKEGEQSKLKINFLNPKTSSIQEHIDYTITVTNAGSAVFGPIPLTHTSLGTATIPVEFKNGENQVVIEIQGILFRPIPTEKASFSITLGEKQSSSVNVEPKTTSDKTQTEKAKPTLPPQDDKAKKSKDSTKKDKSDKKKTDTKKTVKKVLKKPIKKTSEPVKKTTKKTTN
ncbi:MAG: hypothetical protein HZC29_07015 [Thaumarchaeota archaeon]|nr:hypothetical protein [Nitrososphaerota archaeon]